MHEIGTPLSYDVCFVALSIRMLPQFAIAQRQITTPTTVSRHLKGNVAVYKGIFGTSIRSCDNNYCMYTFPIVYKRCFELAALGVYISLSMIISLGTY